MHLTLTRQQLTRYKERIELLCYMNRVAVELQCASSVTAPVTMAESGEDEWKKSGNINKFKR